MTEPFDQPRIESRAMHDLGQGVPEDSPSPGTVYGHAPQANAPGIMPPATRVQARRDVFWQNICREILMALASAAAESSGRLGTGISDAQSSGSPVNELFDGRMGVITTLGQRIPIADVTPVFSCSLPNTELDRSLSNDVQCSIFRVTTPTGETYTFPISQVVGVHSVSQSLLEGIEDQQESSEEKVPFGFAAYTSLARSERENRAQEQPGKPDSGMMGSK
ncbi:MAG: hypothetical protein CMJ35_03610 [Phycisphaerae bacterium]|nr:hypothetical protein [Phycisphaerae bacterium]MBM90685.1 hypothetical protein [Phycisphaerae bacterium]